MPESATDWGDVAVDESPETWGDSPVEEPAKPSRTHFGALSEFGMSQEPSKEELAGATEALTQPIVKIPEAPKFEGDVPISAYPSLAASVAWNRIVKPFGEFAISPLGIMTAGVGGVGGPLVRRAIAA